MKIPIIFNIQRFSLHDGGGIRTLIFFKGCPLHCPWCSNPEGISTQPQIMESPVRCIKCSAPSVSECTNDPDKCPAKARYFAGRYYTVEELKVEALKDEIFYDDGGGITLSGGEPLLFTEYLSQFLPEIKKSGINVAVETAGNIPQNNITQVIEYIDTFLFDLKIINPDKMKQICGGNSELIIENFRYVSKHKRLIPRFPLIPGFTDSMDNLESIRDIIKTCSLPEIHILPYHSLGSSKYDNLGQEYTLSKVSPPSKEQIDNVSEFFRTAGINPVVGGY